MIFNGRRRRVVSNHPEPREIPSMRRVTGPALLAVVACLGLSVSAAAQSSGRVQVFSESFSVAGNGPYFLHLDSGATYRLVTEGADPGEIRITPRAAGASPIRFSASMLTTGGVPFEAPSTGDYRIESNYQGRDVVQVRIFRELRAGETVAVEERRSGKVSPAVFVMLALFPAFLYGVFRNGRTF
jgi:hypothetical protein